MSWPRKPWQGMLLGGVGGYLLNRLLVWLFGVWGGLVLAVAMVGVMLMAYWDLRRLRREQLELDRIHARLAQWLNARWQ